MLRVGLIGLGNIAGSHLDAYERLAKGKAGVSLDAVCDVCPEKTEKMRGNCRIYTDVAEMLEQEKGKLDFVDICVPTFLHARITVQAMEAGFHVLCEKPMARTPEQAQVMIDAANRTGKTLMIAHCTRFYSGIRVLKNIIDSGELGKVRSAEFYREGGSNAPMGWNDWFHDGDLSGGAMLDLHIHDVDAIRWLFGMPNAVSVGAGSTVTKNGYDYLSANFNYDDMYVTASSDWTIAHDRFNTRTFRVNFEKGYFFCDRSPNRQVMVKVAEDGTITDYAEQTKNSI